MVTDIFTPGLTAGNPLALPALNHSIVSSGARFMLASTLHYGAPGPVDLASIAHVLGTLSIPRIYYAPTRSRPSRRTPAYRLAHHASPRRLVYRFQIPPAENSCDRVKRANSSGNRHFQLLLRRTNGRKKKYFSPKSSG